MSRLRGTRSVREASVILSSVEVEVQRLDDQGSPVGEPVDLGTLRVNKETGAVEFVSDGDPAQTAAGWKLTVRERGRESRTVVTRLFYQDTDDTEPGPVVEPEPPVVEPEPDPEPEQPEPEEPVPGSWPEPGTVGFLGEPLALRPMRSGAIRTAGTVIEGRRIDCSDGELGIHADNVTIRNCVINCGVWGIFLYNGADNLVVEDCTFIGGYQAAIGLSQAANWRVSRCDFHSGRDAIKPGGSGVIEDCHMHDPSTGGDAHNDCLQFSDCDGVIVRRNLMEGADTSCIAMFDGQATFRNVTIEGNHMTGAGYILYAGGSTGSGVKVRHNVFGRWGWGPVTDWGHGRPGNEWSGNVDTEGRTITP